METKMKSQRGVTPSGKDLNPGDLAEESEEATADRKEAPAPGLPISVEEYERLKEAAQHAPAQRVKDAQEDRSKGEK